MPGRMLFSYDGERHDGVYALQRYSRWVDAQLDGRFAADACLDDLVGVRELTPSSCQDHVQGPCPPSKAVGPGRGR
ncbi:hypothetical protein [Streptomyces sp. NPDC007205]|uniref:hypothetical protein n=1 Tax=Streptomyces sp. NPDC007205 TaxID=3154316 RepID=UPI0033F79C53